MVMQWSPAFQIGHEQVDTAQKALFASANELEATDDWIALRPLIVALFNHMRKLFEQEEALMRQIAYPELQAHLAQHQLFLERLDDRSMDVGKGHMNKKSIVAVMTDWAQNHVTRDDAALAVYLKKNT